ncbi:hypothetical protein [Streptomyces sp. NPDC010273]
MQDGADIPAEEPEPKITIVLREGAEPNPVARRRLLEILFGSRRDNDAA